MIWFVFWTFELVIGTSVAYFLWRLPIKQAKLAGNWYEGHPVRQSATVTPVDSSIRFWGHGIALAVLLASVTFLASSYGRFPDPMPVHWDAAGVADRGHAKSWGSVLMMPLLGILLVVGMLVLDVVLARHNDPRYPDGDAVAAAELRSVNRRGVHYGLVISSITIALTFSVLSALPILNLSARQVATLSWTLAIIALLAVAGIIVWVVLKRKEVPPSGEGSPDSPDDDRHWIWGVIYVNRDDPSFVVPRRTGIGYTVNFGGWKGICFLLGFLVLVVVIVMLPF